MGHKRFFCVFRWIAHERHICAPHLHWYSSPIIGPLWITQKFSLMTSSVIFGGSEGIDGMSIK